MIVIRWSELGTVTGAGDYTLADGSLVTVTQEYLETAQEIFEQGIDPQVTLLPTSQEDEMPQRYRLGQFE